MDPIVLCDITEDYVFHQKIAKGGYGVVYEITPKSHVAENILLVVKHIKEVSKTVEISETLRHPNILLTRAKYNKNHDWWLFPRK